MEYLGLNDKDSVVSKSDVQERLSKISDRVKQHRRKVRENVLPDLEEISIVAGSYFPFSASTGSIVKAKSYAQPFKMHRFYLTPGNYKVVFTVKRNTGNDKLKFTFTNARMTSPQSRTVILSDVLSLNFKSYEYEFNVPQMGTYDFTIAINPTTEAIEISTLELLRVYQ